MDFQQLFEDLTAQLGEELERELRFQHEDDERQRQARLTLIARLESLAKNNQSGPVELGLVLNSGLELSVIPQTCGKDWFLADVLSPNSFEGSAIIPITAIAEVTFPREYLQTSLGNPDSQKNHDRPQPRLTHQIGLGFILRDLARRRSSVVVQTERGHVRGVLDRVGADHLEIAESGLRDDVTVITLGSIVFVRLG